MAKTKVERNDSWQSLLTGLGTNQDKRTYNQTMWDARTQEFYEQLYGSDETSSRIVNVVPDESLRKWVTWVGVEKETTEQIGKRCKQIDLKGALEKTWKWGRAYGGGCLYVVTDTSDPASPLRKGKERVLGLRDLSRYDLRILPTDVETDFASPNWGNPNIYYLMVQMGTVFKNYPIHWTRMIRFDGQLLPRRTFIRNNYWHDSILNRLYNVIRNYQTSNDAVATMLQDFNVDVFKMKNLANLMQSGKENTVKKRVEMMTFSKSMIRAMILDGDMEEYDNLQRSVEGVAELLQRQSDRLVAATDIPHTKLLGESPDGSNATGNSTSMQWVSHVKAEQENYLRPKLQQLIEILFPEMPDLGFTFNNLYELSEKEQADLRYQTAQTDQIYISTGVLDPSEVAASRFGGDEWTMETELDEDAREAGLIGGPEPQETEEDEEPTPPNKPGAKKDSEGASPAEGVGGNPYAMRLEPGPSTKKVERLVGISMSEPFRDPKTDPKTRSGSVPNQPRVIEPTVGNGVTAQSGILHTDPGVAATMKEFSKGTLKSGSGKKVTDPKQAAAIGYASQRKK